MDVRRSCAPCLILGAPVKPIRRIFPGVIGKVRKRSFDAQPIPHNPAVDPLGPRHAPVRNHLVEFRRPDADVPGRLVPREPARRIGEIEAKAGSCQGEHRRAR